MTNPIRNISDTALWVAIYRAMESERPDAIFRDPYARRMAGERGEAIVKHMPRGKSFAWPMIVRTAVMDEIIQRCVGQGEATVLNLAAGLDARPYRLELPPSLRWFQVDLPDMIAYVKEHLAGETPRCAVEYVAADLTDISQRRDVFARAAAAGPVLVITEGLRDESWRLNRTVRLGWLWRLITPLYSKKRQEEGRRMAGIVLLEGT